MLGRGCECVRLLCNYFIIFLCAKILGAASTKVNCSLCTWISLPQVRHGASEFGFTMHPKVQVSSKTESKIRITNSLPHTNCTNCSAQTLQTCGVVPVSFSEGAVARNFSKRPLLFHVHRGQAQRHTPEGTFISNSFADFQSFQVIFFFKFHNGDCWV